MTNFYDPPGGWRYGFPKEYKPFPGESIEETLLRDGYPQHEINKDYAKHCRFWEKPDTVADDPPVTTFAPLEQTNDNLSADRIVDHFNRGPYISTLNGRFYPFDPRPEEVDILHIAHSLAMTCRYTGACKKFYSTAEHSVLIARWLLPRFGPRAALAGLLHDAAEALTGFGDTARPSKVKAPIIKETEERIYRLAVAPAFGLDPDLPFMVHEADSRIIADEMQQNMHEVDPAYTNPLGIRLELWSPEIAEIYFLDTFRALTKETARRAS